MTQEPENPTTVESAPDELEQEAADLDLPSGDHPLEVAARRGFGPLSQLSTEVWHGQARPCVSCGQLVERGAAACDFCSQDLSEEMLEKMRQHAGPWYVLEHLRPFPGVSLERIVRQIRRGLITETSIVRGPATDYQWRFAVETPSLCRYFLRCWNCHHEVAPTDTYCPSCLTHLSFQRFPEPREPEAARPGAAAPAASAGPSGARVSPIPARSHSTAELTKPLEVRPEYLPAGPAMPATPAMAGPAVSGSLAPGAASGAYAAHLRHDLPHAAHLRSDAPQVAAAPFESRPAAPVASPLGLPDSTPTFAAGHRSVGAGSMARQHAASNLASSGAGLSGAGGIGSPQVASGFPPLAKGGLAGVGPTAAFQSRDRQEAVAVTPQLARLATAVASFDQTTGDIEPATPALPRAAWIAGAVVVIAIITLIALASS